jgi:hypothetical protein
MPQMSGVGDACCIARRRRFSATGRGCDQHQLHPAGRPAHRSRVIVPMARAYLRCPGPPLQRRLALEAMLADQSRASVVLQPSAGECGVGVGARRRFAACHCFSMGCIARASSIVNPERTMLASMLPIPQGWMLKNFETSTP